MLLVVDLGFQLSELLFQASELRLLFVSIPPNILYTLEGPLLFILAVANVTPQPPILRGQLVH